MSGYNYQFYITIIGGVSGEATPLAGAIPQESYLPQRAVDTVWYRYVVYGEAQIDGVLYSAGLREMSPTEEKMVPYAATPQGIKFIDIIPDPMMPIDTIEVSYESQTAVATSNPIAIVNGEPTTQIVVNGQALAQPFVVWLRPPEVEGVPGDTGEITLAAENSVVIIKTALPGE